MEIRYVTSCMPSERSGKNMWRENDLVQGFIILDFVQDFDKHVEQIIGFTSNEAEQH